jgi:hypothetical protein
MQPITATNVNVVVDTAETYSQNYIDYFSTEIVKREERRASTQAAGSLRMLQTSSGLVSAAMDQRTPPRTTFNPAPIPESQQSISPINSFALSAIVESLGSSTSFQQSSISAESTLSTVTEADRLQTIAYSRNLR